MTTPPAPSSGQRTIAITGATGLLGKALCLRFADEGWTVRAMGRREDASLAARGVRTYACDLPDTLDQAAFDGCDVVVHAAYATRYRSRIEALRTNEAGTIRILETARRARIKQFIFVSSMSAHDKARSYYGQSKLRMESFLDPARDLAVRPGLVLSGAGGLFARMAATIRRSPVVPLFGGGRQPIQTIHIDDSCRGVGIAIDRALHGVLTLAEPEPLAFRGLMDLIAARVGRRPRYLGIPIAPALAALRFAESFGLHPPVSSENLLGLLSLRAVECRSDLEKLGLTVRPASRSIADLPLD